MNNPAITDREIHPLISQRWSPRAFNSKLVETEKLAQPSDLQEREKTPRTRQPLSSFVFTGAWEIPATFIYQNSL
jgi:hypothetical protein